VAVLTVAAVAVGPLGAADDAQARVVDRRVRLSLLSSTTTLAPKVAYSSSRRTQAANSSAERSLAGSRPRLRAAKVGLSTGVVGVAVGAEAVALPGGA
jgi:hypothetical protein